MEQEAKDKKNKNVHAGHRQRLKKRFDETGFKGWADHEVLELLLSYAQPRRNTNPIAHTLLEKFNNSIQDVFSASTEELMEVDQVGIETARFIHLVRDFFEIYQKKQSKKPVFVTESNFIRFFRENYKIKDSEHFYIFCLSDKHRLLRVFEYNVGCELVVTTKASQVRHDINKVKSCYLIFAHTHPNGIPEPTLKDYNSTERLVKICVSMGVPVFDHVIFSETDFKSMKDFVLGVSETAMKNYQDLMGLENILKRK